MIKRNEYKEAQKRAFKMIQDAGIVIQDKEIDKIAVADFGLSNLEKEGIQVFTLLKELAYNRIMNRCVFDLYFI